jgi:hypothetical protein
VSRSSGNKIVETCAIVEATELDWQVGESGCCGFSRVDVSLLPRNLYLLEFAARLSVSDALVPISTPW